MKKRKFVFVAVLTMSILLLLASCGGSNSNLVGMWNHTRGNSWFEFLSDGTALDGGRLGNWRTDGDELIIEWQAGNVSEWRFEILGNDTLIIYDGFNTRHTFRRAN